MKKGKEYRRYLRYRKAKRSFCVSLIIFIVVQIFFAAIFAGGFHDNKNLTENDCTVVIGTVDLAEYFSARRIHNYYITVDSETFYFSTKYMASNPPPKDLEKELKGKEVTLLIRDKKNIVALSYDDHCYGGIESYNEEARNQRFAMWLIIFLIWFPITLVLVGVAVIQIMTANFEKPQKTKKEKTQQAFSFVSGIKK